jgi:hypothetical protein
MRTSLLTRVAAVTAIAATSGLAVTGTASASVTHPKKHQTSLSIRAPKSRIKPGHKSDVSGVLKSGRSDLAHEVVYLDRVAGKKLIVVGKERTNRAGKVSFVVSPKVTRRYELVFRGTGKFAASHSGIVTIKVS